MSDSCSALAAIKFNKWSSQEEWLPQNIRALLHDIAEQGSQVQFQWIKSHSGILENDEADRTAKSATSSGERKYLIAIPWQDLFAHIKNKQLTDWRKTTINNLHPTSHYYKIATEISQSCWFQKYPYTREEIVLISRLRTNHILSCQRLHKIGLNVSDVCVICGEQPGTIHHMILQCSKFPEESNRLYKQLSSIGFQFPTNITQIVLHPSPKVAQALSRYVSRTKLKL